MDMELGCCNLCVCSITEATDLDLRVNCFDKEGHPHKMEKLGFDLDDGSSTGDQKQTNTQESRRLSIQRCIQSLVHACQCRDANCRLPSCQKMKRVVQHAKSCKRKTKGGCPTCKQLIALCCYHAKYCQEAKCPVPFCLNIKHKLRRKQLQQKLPQLERRIATMQNRGLPGSVPQPSPGNSNSCSQPSPSAPPHCTSPQPPQPGIGMMPSTGPPVAAQQPAPHMVAAGNYGKGNPVISPPTGSPSVMPSQQMHAQMQKPMSQMLPGFPNRMLQSIGGTSSWEGSGGYTPQGIQGQPQQIGLRQPNQFIFPVGVSNAMGNPGAPMGPPQGLPAPGPTPSLQRPTQALHQLLQTLKSPTSPQQQQKVLNILKSNPQLMAAFIKQRTAQRQAQLPPQQQQQIMISEGNIIGPPPTQGQVQQLWYQKQKQQQHVLAMQRQRSQYPPPQLPCMISSNF